MTIPFGRLLLSVVVLLSGCGGGGDDGAAYELQVAVTQWEITDEQREAMSGDWDIGDGNTGSFIVRTQAEFDQLWARRKAYVTCSTFWNRGFCASDAPPPVDFSKHALVGLLLSSVYHFGNNTPRSVTTDAEHKRLSVIYRYGFLRSPSVLTVNGVFFLVPKTEAALEVNSNFCNSSC